MKHYLFLLFLLFYIKSFSQINDLSISSIWDLEYTPERIESIKQLKNSKGFTRIKIDHEKKISKIFAGIKQNVSRIKFRFSLIGVFRWNCMLVASKGV